MKILKYYLNLLVVFCSCAHAIPKEKTRELACPYILPAEKNFPASWVTVRKISAGKFQLRETAIADGNASELKSRLLAKDRIFDTDIIDEWEKFKDRSEAIAEYPEDHREVSMMCTYGKTQHEAFDLNLNVELLIPLPPKKYVTCLLVRRDVDPTHEISCKVK